MSLGRRHIPDLSADYFKVIKGFLVDSGAAFDITLSYKGNVATTGAAATELDKIDNLVDDATNLVLVYVTCKSDDDTRYGTWIDQLTVSKNSGTVTIRKRLTIAHFSSAGLKTKDVDYTANGGDIDIDVTGIAATNIQWDSQYEIKVTSSN